MGVHSPEQVGQTQPLASILKGIIIIIAEIVMIVELD